MLKFERTRGIFNIIHMQDYVTSTNQVKTSQKMMIFPFKNTVKQSIIRSPHACINVGYLDFTKSNTN